MFNGEDDKKEQLGQEEETVEIPADFICPITKEIMDDPVKAADGHSYERKAIEERIESGHHDSPITMARLAHTGLTPNHDLIAAIRKFKAKLKREVMAELKEERDASETCQQGEPREKPFIVSDVLPPQHQHPYAKCVGIIDKTKPFASYGTGFLIAKDLFMTAYHCISDSDQPSIDELSSISIKIGSVFFEIVEVVEGDKEIDYAILRLSGNPGERFGYAKLEANLPEKNTRVVSIIQYPDMSQYGNSKKIADGYFLKTDGHRCCYTTNTDHGSSGSPVFNIADDPKVIAVHTTGFECGDKQNKGTTIAAIAERSRILKEIFEAQRPVMMGHAAPLARLNVQPSFFRPPPPAPIPVVPLTHHEEFIEISIQVSLGQLPTNQGKRGPRCKCLPPRPKVAKRVHDYIKLHLTVNGKSTHLVELRDCTQMQATQEAKRLFANVRNLKWSNLQSALDWLGNLQAKTQPVEAWINTAISNLRRHLQNIEEKAQFVEAVI